MLFYGLQYSLRSGVFSNCLLSPASLIFLWAPLSHLHTLVLLFHVLRLLQDWENPSLAYSSKEEIDQLVEWFNMQISRSDISVSWAKTCIIDYWLSISRSQGYGASTRNKPLYTHEQLISVRELWYAYHLCASFLSVFIVERWLRQVLSPLPAPHLRQDWVTFLRALSWAKIQPSPL